jgi:hypothetical protein
MNAEAIPSEMLEIESAKLLFFLLGSPFSSPPPVNSGVSEGLLFQKEQGKGSEQVIT